MSDAPSSDAPPDAATPPRERIVRTALRLIGEGGIGAVSHRQVAAAAGVSLGTLTYHFRDRTELLRESLRRFVADEVARIEALGAGLRSGDRGIADLAGIVAAVMQDAADVSSTVAQFELYLHATRDPALAASVAECRAAYEALAVQALQRLEVPDPAGIAPLVVSTIDGLALQRVATGADVTPMIARSLLLIAAGARAGGLPESDAVRPGGDPGRGD